MTPVVAVIDELRKIQPDAEFQFWCDKGFSAQASSLMKAAFGDDVTTKTITAGKFRRYHSMSIWQQLRHPLTILLPNIIDVIKFGLGIVQSMWGLVIWRPDVIFTKGGFVCLPIGIAAWVLHIPLVIHDSDAHPGLTNRILSRWAVRIATGAPLEYYTYPKSKSEYIGIPVAKGLQPPTTEQQAQLKAKLGLPAGKPLLVVTGGGLGAVRINNAVVAALPELLKENAVVLVSGQYQYEEIRQAVGDDTHSLQLHAFISGNMLEYMAAADLVISRAGMTAINELAALGKPTILVPNPDLTGGHQLKNAQVYADMKAAVIFDDAKLAVSGELSRVVRQILASAESRAELSMNIHKFARPTAAQDMARLILSVRDDTMK